MSRVIKVVEYPVRFKLDEQQVVELYYIISLVYTQYTYVCFILYKKKKTKSIESASPLVLHIMFYRIKNLNELLGEYGVLIPTFILTDLKY